MQCEVHTWWLVFCSDTTQMSVFLSQLGVSSSFLPTPYCQKWAEYANVTNTCDLYLSSHNEIHITTHSMNSSNHFQSLICQNMVVKNVVLGTCDEWVPHQLITTCMITTCMIQAVSLWWGCAGEHYAILSSLPPSFGGGDVSNSTMNFSC